MKKIAQYVLLFCIFGLIYADIESIWKGHLTHWSMFVLSGFIGILIGGINEWPKKKIPFILQCLIGMVIATIGEGLTGLIVNVWLGLGVWDYSNTPLNFFWGQCSGIFCAIWFILSGICVVVDDWIRYNFFGRERPDYYI